MFFIKKSNKKEDFDKKVRETEDFHKNIKDQISKGFMSLESEGDKFKKDWEAIQKK